MRTRLTVRRGGRVECPVCGNAVWYPGFRAGEDVSEVAVPVHSEGLIGSGRRCFAAGLLGWGAFQLGADVDRDPLLCLRAHP